MAFQERVSEREHIDLPVNGQTYRVYEPDAALGATVVRLMEIGARAAKAVKAGKPVAVDDAVLSDVEERDLAERLIGDAWDDLMSDGVLWSDVQRVLRTVMAWIAGGLDAAEQVWAAGDDQGEAEPTPDKPGSRRASGVSANTTRKAGSGTRTKVSKPSAAGRRGQTS
ncbi:hypothetical protein [Stackebrandtia soli]|uniref:DUF7426 family protein n=1 Tax=Stackebrandtia soli TaxID=1892856 RepID=UPI0039E81145